MTPGQRERASALLQACRELEPGRREAYLADACPDDPEVRREVEALLQQGAPAPDPIEPGDATHPGPLTALLREVAATDGPSGLPDPLLGQLLGPWRLVAEIGRGGMGAVYRAVRDDDAFRKDVAVKLLPIGRATPAMAERFRAERSILARLEHPHIARLLDGGASTDGRPYLVMELVQGEPIDRYCERKGLGLRPRLELFRATCEAVQYAHRNLVVHRDVKPGNILVTSEGVPKLLDFGIAKMLEAEAPGDAALTAAELRALTPRYASPEQVLGGPITPASDVYSLGVLLYELLTGRPPHERRAQGPGELVRMLQGEVTTRPSAVAAAGAVPSREIAGDLDWIVLTAMRREPERRYASAGELSADVRRHLEGQPVLARPDSLGYRAGKFVRRHRVGVAGAAAVVLSLAGGLAGTAREWRRAEAEHRSAERRFRDVRAMANAFLFEFHDAIADLPGSTKARELVLRRAAEYLDGLGREARGDDGLAREVAMAYQRLAEIQGGVGANLGDTRGARESYGKAVEIRRALVARGGRPADLEELAHLEFSLGGFLAGAGELSAAEESIRAAAERIEALGGADGRDRRGMQAAAYQRLGYVQARRGLEPAALGSLRRAVSVAEAFSAAHPEATVARSNLAYALTELAERLQRAGEPDEALARVRRALGIREALAAADPNNARLQRDLVDGLVAEGASLAAAGRQRESLEGLRRARALSDRLVAADPRDAWSQATAVTVDDALGVALVEAGQARDGVELLRRAAAQAERLAGADSGYQRNKLALVLSHLGRAEREGGLGPAATAAGCRALARAVELWEALHREGRAFGENEGDRVRAEADLARPPCRGRH